MERDLAGRRAVVTGASSGIGRAVARLLAARGAELVLTARRRERLEELARELEAGCGAKVSVIDLDLSAPGAAEELFRRATGDGGRVDLLVNNAGFGANQRFTEIPWERHQAMLQLNVVALSELSHRFGQHMLAHGRPSHILNVASIGAYMPAPYLALYAASKSYVLSLTEALAFELRGTNVSCTCLSPGGTLTEFSEVAEQKVPKSAGPIMMSAERVAEIGVAATLRRRASVVPGLLNKLTCVLCQLLPRWLVIRATAVAMRLTMRRSG